MQFDLRPHPSTPLSVAAEQVRVAVHRGTPSTLTLTCQVAGDMGRITLPQVAEPGRADDLWRQTCLELFLRAEGDGYYEFNFSPSLRWAAYRFAAYRQGMTEASPRKITGLGCRSETGGFGGHATVDLAGLEGVDLAQPLHIGLSAVIEQEDGLSYWALAHPPGQPDFHHPAAFAVEVPTVVYW